MNFCQKQRERKESHNKETPVGSHKHSMCIFWGPHTEVLHPFVNSQRLDQVMETQLGLTQQPPQKEQL